MSKILYGAAVQGIQGFIFQTNKLKDIVGASELVERVCTSAFAEQIGSDVQKLAADDNMIVMAAGNILYIFEDEEKCRKTVLNFPKKVMEMAPGITISQATACMKDDESDFARASEELQSRLKTQRNKPQRPLATGLTGMQRSRQTGFPALSVNGKQTYDGEFVDIATFAKRKAEKELSIADRNGDGLSRKNFGDEAIESMKPVKKIDDLTGKNDWIAIIHADGNGLGRIVQTIGKHPKLYKEFSARLNSATITSAREAFKEIQSDVSAIRPIVLNGDDHTVIIRGDLAVNYATAFMKAFEKNTRQELSAIYSDNNDIRKLLSQGLTACAGIAYIKSSFPFYFGYSLAEELCGFAKKDAKSIAAQNNSSVIPSCLMFHKVQDSFTEEYREIAARELTPNNKISFQFGPYYLDKNTGVNSSGEIKWDIETLTETVNALNSHEGNAVKSHLRQWISVLHQENGIPKGDQLIKRLKTIAPSASMRKIIDRCYNKGGRTNPTYDVMALSSITYQETK